MGQQLPINFDAPPTPLALAREGETSAIGAATEAWREAALNALLVVCRKFQTFTVDNFWSQLGERTDSPDKRAAAGILSEGLRRGWCERTKDLKPSDQRQCHHNLRSVYRSLLKDA